MNHHIKGIFNYIEADFSLETIEDRCSGVTYLKYERENLSTENSVSEKTILKIPDTQKLRKFIISRLAL